MGKIVFALFVALIAVGYSLPASADLTVVGNRLIYDSDLDITWYDFTHEAATLEQQKQWVSGLKMTRDYQDQERWRLPMTVNVGVLMTSGYNSTGAEMGHLYYASLGNTDWGLTNQGPFENLVPAGYWSGVENAASQAWYFYFNDGYQNVNGNGATYRALAVHDGLVTPIPGTLALFGSGLAGLVAWGRIYRRRQG